MNLQDYLYVYFCCEFFGSGSVSTFKLSYCAFLGDNETRFLMKGIEIKVHLFNFTLKVEFYLFYFPVFFFFFFSLRCFKTYYYFFLFRIVLVIFRSSLLRLKNDLAISLDICHSLNSIPLLPFMPFCIMVKYPPSASNVYICQMLMCCSK